MLGGLGGSGSTPGTLVSGKVNGVPPVTPLAGSTPPVTALQKAIDAYASTGAVQTGIVYSGSMSPTQPGYNGGSGATQQFVQPIYYDPVTGMPQLV